MKTICLVGGKLQGFEAAYLSKKAGMKVVVIDKNPQALIKNYADEFHCFNVINEPEKLLEISKSVDAVLPVNENLECIEFLSSIKEKFSCPVLFDFEAYWISRDKKKSKEYFASIGVPTPQEKPSEPPYFVKPPCESSSVGARIIYDEEELGELEPGMLIEEYVEGEVVSLEVIGDGTHFAVVKETLIHIEETYDCHMVTPLPPDPSFREISYSLAANLSLKGIMDVEAISSSRGLKVIEIDARFPSQTPTVVYYSSGINLIELLFRAFTEGVEEIKTLPEDRYCIYEHLMLAENGSLVPVGEQVLSLGNDYGKYYEEPGIEIFLCKGDNPVFTLVFWGKDREEAEIKKDKGLSVLRDRFRAAM
ncbi:Pyrrolysine synthetase [Methanosarcina lacustris Z-7289]|uniref:Pyrrolysine synthetase n=1 Tax=Methanosarcina lacustris Z-7289 TaxID=1434111 RepID=A0A0E3WSH3_9EURY|nr:3-methylornithine--L-lysine ligase PylC [Methanosarcina lacustris]AKB76470.1 Pyrrolysine synthetase [Methanosarcina lacustris Z-7289]